MKALRMSIVARTLGLGIAAASLAAGGSVAMAQGQWQSVKAADGSFSVRMPPPGAPDTQTFQGNNGPVSVTSYRATANDGYWAAGTINYERRLNRTPVQMLDDARNGVIARAKGTMKSETPVSAAGAQGRELVYVVQNDQGTYHVRQRFYVAAPDRLIQVAYVGTPGSEANAAVTQFMDSVQIRKQ